jgi:hypothetical protein
VKAKQLYEKEGKLDAKEKQLGKREGDMQALDSLNQSLLTKERESSDQLKGTRKIVIEVRVQPMSSS